MTYEEDTEALPFTHEMEAGFRQIILDQAPDKLTQLSVAIGEYRKFTHLPTAAAAAFHLGQFADAKRFAEQALALASAYKEDWNVGNAIHLGHTVLGLLALNNGDHLFAIRSLKASGQTPGSPQLSSFGPTMHLAKALLKAGHVEAVLAYLNQCRAFWEMGGAWLDVWERKIREGRVPNFFQHSYV